MVAFDGGYEVDGESGQQDRGVFVTPLTDCNANGLSDYCEHQRGLATDSDGDGVIDSCHHYTADLNSDGFVDVFDTVDLMVA